MHPVRSRWFGAPRETRERAPGAASLAVTALAPGENEVHLRERIGGLAQDGFDGLFVLVAALVTDEAGPAMDGLSIPNQARALEHFVDLRFCGMDEKFLDVTRDADIRRQEGHRSVLSLDQ